ncbi:MAG: hypothetical protein CMD33_01075 [Flavobacteriales bacterium]|nr:hypothetical protein [Flavobacteriales bacterium]
MANSFSPLIILHVVNTTDTATGIPSGQSATVTLPPGTWRLVSAQATANANTNKIDVKSNAGTPMLAATAVNPVTGLILPATATTVTTTGSLKVGCTVNGPINDVFLTLAPAGTAVFNPTVTIA